MAIERVWQMWLILVAAQMAASLGILLYLTSGAEPYLKWDISVAVAASQAAAALAVLFIFRTKTD